MFGIGPIPKILGEHFLWQKILDEMSGPQNVRVCRELHPFEHFGHNKISWAV